MYLRPKIDLIKLMAEEKSELSLISDRNTDVESKPLIQGGEENKGPGLPMQYLNPFFMPVEQRVIVAQEIFHRKYWIVFKLINEGKLPADLLIDKENKWYLIHFLITANKCYKIKALIELFNADPNILDKYMQTPLHIAATHHRTEIILLLTADKRVNIEIRDSLNCTPLVNCVKQSYTLGFVYLYFEKNANAAVYDSQGRSLADWAAAKNDVGMLALLSHIPEVNFRSASHDGLLPIERGITSMSYDATKYLLHRKHANDSAEQLRNYAKKINDHPHIEDLFKKEIAAREISSSGIANYITSRLSFSDIKNAFTYFYEYRGRTFFLILFTTFLILLECAFGIELSFIWLLFQLNVILLLVVFRSFWRGGNPGYIPKKQFPDRTNCITLILEKFKKGDEELESHYCLDCLIVKPRGAYHCFKCNKCVMGYHRHLKNSLGGVCLGINNYSSYVLTQFLTFTLLVIYLHKVLCMTHAPIAPFPVCIVERYCNLFYKGSFVFLVTMIITIVFIQMLYNVLAILIAASYGMTLHELYHPNMHEYLFEKRWDQNFKGVLWVPHRFSDIQSNLVRFFKGLFYRKEEDNWKLMEELKTT